MITFLVYITFLIGLKHYFGDVYFQYGRFSWISQGKREPSPMWQKALGFHCLIHAGLMTCAMVFIMGGYNLKLKFLWPIIISDFLSHAIIDKLKVLFWDNHFGLYFDQFLHSVFYLIVLSYLYIVYFYLNYPLTIL